MRAPEARASQVHHVWMSAGLAILAVVVGLALQPLMLDDAYITYSFARNFARSGLLVHHSSFPYLGTTAPLYAMLLGVLGVLGLDIPVASNAIGMGAIFGAALLLYWLCSRRGQPWAGVVAGLLLITAPLLWLSLGLETCFFILLICAACFAYDTGHVLLTAFMLGLASLTRADGILATAVISLYHFCVLRRPIPVRAIGVYLAVLAPVVAYLFWAFGSPIPVTLAAKRAQVQLGITGFFTDTTVLKGLAILGEGWFKQSPLFGLYPALLLVGLPALRRGRWAWAIILWSVLHLASYMILRVAPYFWYYAPLVPGGVMLVGLGAQWLQERAASSWQKAIMLAPPMLLLFAQMTSLAQMAAALTGPQPPPTSAAVKVLPTSNDRIYRAVGEWLNANTPKQATVGVTEVGIIGYYADRPMIDYLGVLQPDVAQALERGDLYYTIPHYMPDYLVLGRDLGTFGLRLDQDQWFLANYQVRHEITDERFFDRSLIILQSRGAARPMIQQARTTPFTEDIELSQLTLEEERLRPGDAIRVRADWIRRGGAAQDLLTIVYLDDARGEMRVWGESHTNTGLWPVDRNIPIYYRIALPADLPAGKHTLGIRMVLDGEKNVIRKFGELMIAQNTARAEGEPPSQ